MNRLVLTGALIVAILILDAVSHHAAGLHVDAGVLQTQTSAVEIDVPDDPVITVAISFTAYRRTGQQVHAHGPTAATLEVGSWYEAGWTGSGQAVTCPANALPSDKTLRGPGTYQAMADGDFEFCVDGGSGLPTFTSVPAPASQQQATS
jgi:hypothetical protein